MVTAHKIKAPIIYFEVLHLQEIVKYDTCTFLKNKASGRNRIITKVQNHRIYGIYECYGFRPCQIAPISPKTLAMTKSPFTPEHGFWASEARRVQHDLQALHIHPANSLPTHPRMHSSRSGCCRRHTAWLGSNPMHRWSSFYSFFVDSTPGGGGKKTKIIPVLWV